MSTSNKKRAHNVQYIYIDTMKVYNIYFKMFRFDIALDLILKIWKA